ncbi:MAG: radical SAM protein [Deltaproteobacteria bacterium]|nr:MAG: radical SAM protein [Deltaproteobacteria bacterium]
MTAAPPSASVALPTPAEARENLRRILTRGSVNLGAASGVERLLLMVTRSCQLRCGYCFVDKTESGPSMPPAVARRAVDLLMRSERPSLELQLFGGEPTSRWDLVTDAMTYASGHPARAGRDLQFVLTTNGVGLTPERVAWLADQPVTVLFSLDGDAAAHRRYRPVHRGPDATWAEDDARTWERIDRAVDLLLAHPVRWFANIVLPPAAADEVEARYHWARARGVPAVQLNYAVGMLWDAATTRTFLAGLAAVLLHDHQHPGGPRLFNWASDCEPVMLSDDLIVDVDGTVLHDGAVFLERRFPGLRAAYHRGHLDTLEAFDPLRWSLARIFENMVQSAPKGSMERRIILHNAWLGASVDLLIQRLARALGRSASRGAGGPHGDVDDDSAVDLL